MSDIQFSLPPIYNFPRLQALLADQNIYNNLKYIYQDTLFYLLIC